MASTILSILRHMLQGTAILSSAAIAGSSLSQTLVVMPTIVDPSLSAHASNQLNSIMLHHAHWFYYPLNSISLFSNLALALLYFITRFFSASSSQGGSFLGAVLAPLFCMASTVHTVKSILPINERVHAVADAAPGLVDGEKDEQKRVDRDAEIRSLQERWGKLNLVRCAILFAAAASVLMSPAVGLSFSRLA